MVATRFDVISRSASGCGANRIGRCWTRHGLKKSKLMGVTRSMSPTPQCAGDKSREWGNPVLCRAEHREE